MIGSFGASAVLLSGARAARWHSRAIWSADISSRRLWVLSVGSFPHDYPALAQAMGVATSIALMHLTRTLHPPGGATALIATLGSAEMPNAPGLLVCIDAGNARAAHSVTGRAGGEQPATHAAFYPEVWW